MADYAGAVTAIKARMVEQWKTGDLPRTPVVFQNASNAYDPSSDTDAPWVYFEVISSPTGGLRAAGSPGSLVWNYRGNIYAHVFYPINSGIDDVIAAAVAIGEIFRVKKFYDATEGCYVRTGIGPNGQGPSVDGGGSASDDGQWFRVTATIPFEYVHRG